MWHFTEFQSPYGGRGRSDCYKIGAMFGSLITFQSPYGGRGRSDMKNGLAIGLG